MSLPTEQPPELYTLESISETGSVVVKLWCGIFSLHLPSLSTGHSGNIEIVGRFTVSGEALLLNGLVSHRSPLPLPRPTDPAAVR